MSVFVDKENACIDSQFRPSALKARISNPGVRAIQAKSVVTNTRSTTARKPLGSVNSSRDAKKITGDGKGTKEWGDDIKAKVVGDNKPTATRKKAGLIARPVNESKEIGSKLLPQDAKKKDSFERAPTKPTPLKQKLPEIVIPKLDATEMHRGLDDDVDYPDSPIEHIFCPLPVEEEEDEFQDLWPVEERPTAFIKDIMNWGFIPGRRMNRGPSDTSTGTSPVQCDYPMMTNFDHITLTDDEADEMWPKGIASFDDLPPLPALADLDDLFGEDDAEYFSHLE